MDVKIVVPGLPIALPDPFAVSLGGSETAGLQLGRAFARKGHQVTVFCEVPRPTRWQGVRLVPFAAYIETAAARVGDLLLIQRDPMLLTLPHTAKAAFLWMHDLPGPSIVPGLMAAMAAMAAVDRLLTVSAWHAATVPCRGARSGRGADPGHAQRHRPGLDRGWRARSRRARSLTGSSTARGPSAASRCCWATCCRAS